MARTAAAAAVAVAASDCASFNAGVATLTLADFLTSARRQMAAGRLRPSISSTLNAFSAISSSRRVLFFQPRGFTVGAFVIEERSVDGAQLFQRNVCRRRRRRGRAGGRSCDGGSGGGFESASCRRRWD
uniref:Secreted protein n=1 Tax=Plectus sambesii TaxID=2011161 RepID=A0A914XLP7_9BILA